MAIVGNAFLLMFDFEKSINFLPAFIQKQEAAYPNLTFCSALSPE